MNEIDRYLLKYGLYHNDYQHGEWPDLVDFCDQCQEWAWIVHEWFIENCRYALPDANHDIGEWPQYD